jgi:hypothetical protein
MVNGMMVVLLWPLFKNRQPFGAFIDPVSFTVAEVREFFFT